MELNEYFLLGSSNSKQFWLGTITTILLFCFHLSRLAICTFVAIRRFVLVNDLKLRSLVRTLVKGC